MYFNGLQQTLDNLDSVWLESSKKKYLATEELSFADILCACEIEQTSELKHLITVTHFKIQFFPLGIENFDPFNGRPKLRQWWERVKKDTNPEYDIAHEIIYEFLKKKSSKL